MRGSDPTLINEHLWLDLRVPPRAEPGPVGVREERNGRGRGSDGGARGRVGTTQSTDLAAVHEMGTAG